MKNCAQHANITSNAYYIRETATTDKESENTERKAI